MDDFWNERYSANEYAYGEAPNEFLKEQLAKLSTGKALFPAEGEGRNAVFAASKGWKVTAFDASYEGKRKAELLAAKHKVEIKYDITDHNNASYPENYFDVLVLTFAHMPGEIRESVHKKLSSFLKPGGTLLLEGFTKNQINNNTGGPKNIDFLFSEEELKNDFSKLSHLHIYETETTLNEGLFHRGKASVIRIIGKK